MTFVEEPRHPSARAPNDDGENRRPTFVRILSIKEPLPAGKFCLIWVGLWFFAGLPLALLEGIEVEGPFLIVKLVGPSAWILSATGMAVGWWSCARRLATMGFSRLLSAIFLLPILNIWLVVLAATPDERDPGAALNRGRSAGSWLAAYLAGGAVLFAHVALVDVLRSESAIPVLLLAAAAAMGAAIALTLSLRLPPTMFECLVVSFTVLVTIVVVALSFDDPSFLLSLVCSVLQIPISAIFSTLVGFGAMLMSPLFLLGAGPVIAIAAKRQRAVEALNQKESSDEAGP